MASFSPPLVLAVPALKSVAVPSVCQLEGGHENQRSLVLDQVLSDAAEATGTLEGIGILNRDYSPWNILEHRERGLVIDFSAGKVRWLPLTYYKTSFSVCLRMGWDLRNAACSMQHVHMQLERLVCYQAGCATDCTTVSRAN